MTQDDLDEAERLVMDGWHYDDGTGMIYHRGKEESKPASREVIYLMRAISIGIGIKCQWMREDKEKYDRLRRFL